MDKQERFPTDVYFYDTCSLLLAGEKLFEQEKKFIISSITFKELEQIKTSSHKDDDIKYSARLLLHLLDSNPNKYEVVVHTLDNEFPITLQSLDITDDTRILSDAIYANDELYKDSIVFVTNDLSLKHIANLFFGDGMIESVKEDNDVYTGFKDIVCGDQDLERFYQDTRQNQFQLLCGQYLVLRNQKNEIIDLRCWSGEDHRYINSKPFNSNWLGKIQPFNDDVYQKLLFDSLRNNKITLVSGPAGSGKTLVSLGYLMSEVEHHNLDKIIVFCNTVATANSAKLGFYPGTKNEKLLDSQIGNLLSSKLGGRDGVEQLINTEKLLLLPMSDIRGYDTNGMRAGVYLSEAQNLDRSLMKLALQRIGEDCVCVIDGDLKTQVDMKQYEGASNGMRRASKIFRGTNVYGEVQLQNVHRSQIAKIAEGI